MPDWLEEEEKHCFRGAPADRCESCFPKLHSNKAAPFSLRKEGLKGSPGGTGNPSDLELMGGLSYCGLKQRQGGEHTAHRQSCQANGG